MVKVFAALFPFYMILSLSFCSVCISCNVWMLPFAESGLLPYWCTKVYDNYSFVNYYLLSKPTWLCRIYED